MADNYPAAAEKHVKDAESLFAADRFDGTGYLAGYAVECVLKTLIEVEGGPGRRLGHEIPALAQEIVRLTGLPTQRAARYVKLSGVTLLHYGCPTGWRPALRYEAPGQVSSREAAEWLTEARRLYMEVVVQMKLDGVLP